MPGGRSIDLDLTIWAVAQNPLDAQSLRSVQFSWAKHLVMVVAAACEATRSILKHTTAEHSRWPGTAQLIAC